MITEIGKAVGVFTLAINGSSQFKPDKLKSFSGEIAFTTDFEWDKPDELKFVGDIKITGTFEDEYGVSVIDGFTKNKMSKNDYFNFFKRYEDRIFIYNLKRTNGGLSGVWVEGDLNGENNLDIKKDVEIGGYAYLFFNV